VQFKFENTTKNKQLNYTYMNTLQNVYNKLSDKTELAKHEVNLAITDKLKVELKKYVSLVSASGKNLDNFYTPIRQLEREIAELKANTANVAAIAQDLRKQEDLVSAELDLVTKKVNEAKADLGIKIDINELVDLSSLNSTNTISTRIQSDANAYLKYVNTLQKPTI
jgi:uncharacterized protein YicC (UPF0701 family)